jgi:sugar O-acyltransferase (sialic acid O-acetyltransferase NeuD family)
MTTGAAAAAAAPLLIFPCNGNAIEALDCLQPSFRLLAFVDDTPEKQDSVVHGHRVVSRAGFKDWPSARVLAVPGSPTSFRSRQQLIAELRVDRSRFAQVIHPSARISPLARIGHNVLIMAGVVVTSNAVIGDHVCVLPNTVIHHDVSIGDWSLVGSNVTLAGGVQVGENCYVGSGASVMHGVCIGTGALIGLGSTVIRNVSAGDTVAGCPARALRT